MTGVSPPNVTATGITQGSAALLGGFGSTNFVLVPNASNVGVALPAGQFDSEGKGVEVFCHSDSAVPCQVWANPNASPAETNPVLASIRPGHGVIYWRISALGWLSSPMSP